MEPHKYNVINTSKKKKPEKKSFWTRLHFHSLAALSFDAMFVFVSLQCVNVKYKSFVIQTELTYFFLSFERSV